MTHNSYRGEISVKLKDQYYILKLTFDQLVKLEQEVNKGILKIAKDFSEGNYGIHDIAALLWFSLSEEGRQIYTIASLGNLVLESGLSTYASHCIDLLSLTLEGGTTRSKKSNLSSQ